MRQRGVPLFAGFSGLEKFFGRFSFYVKFTEIEGVDLLDINGFESGRKRKSGSSIFLSPVRGRLSAVYCSLANFLFTAGKLPLSRQGDLPNRPTAEDEKMLELSHIFEVNQNGPQMRAIFVGRVGFEPTRGVTSADFLTTMAFATLSRFVVWTFS